MCKEYCRFPSADVPLFSDINSRNKPLPLPPLAGSSSNKFAPTRPLPPTPVLHGEYANGGQWYRKVSLWPPLDLGDPFASSSKLGEPGQPVHSTLPSVAGSETGPDRPSLQTSLSYDGHSLPVKRPEPARRATSPLLGKRPSFPDVFRRPRRFLGFTPADTQGSHKSPHRPRKLAKARGHHEFLAPPLVDERPNIRMLYPCFDNNRDGSNPLPRRISPTASRAPSVISSHPTDGSSSLNGRAQPRSIERISTFTESFSDYSSISPRTAYSELSRATASTAPTSIHPTAGLSKDVDSWPMGANLRGSQSMVTMRDCDLTLLPTTSLPPAPTAAPLPIQSPPVQINVPTQPYTPQKEAKTKHSFVADQPLSTQDIFKASLLNVLDSEGKPFRFGRIFEDQLTIVCFIRHFWYVHLTYTQLIA